MVRAMMTKSTSLIMYLPLSQIGGVWPMWIPQRTVSAMNVTAANPIPTKPITGERERERKEKKICEANKQ
jgi:hypothetical protein